MPPQAAVPARRSLETYTVWALIATVILAAVVLIPSVSVPFLATKSFIFAAGALITLALFILSRLSRGNIVLPPGILLGALWLPVLAYALSALFSGTSFAGALWGTSLEPDTVGFMLVAAVLGTLTTLAIRRGEQYRSMLAALAWAFGLIVAIQVLILLVGQTAPNTVSPALSILGSSADLANFLGLGLVGILLALRSLELSPRAKNLFSAAGIVSLALLAVLNTTLPWVLVALTALGLFVEAVMKHRPTSADADLDESLVLRERNEDAPESGPRPFVMPLVVLAVSLFFLIGSSLGAALATSFNVNVLSVRPSWQSTLAVAHKTYSEDLLFGSGPNTFGTEWLKSRDASLNSTIFWNVDFASGVGFLPTSLATTGLVGALAWLGFIGLFLFFGIRMLLVRTPEDPIVRFTATLSFIATLYLLLVAVFGLPDPVLVALLFVFFGLFASTTRYALGSEQWGVIFSRAPRLGFVIVFVLTLVLLGSVASAYGLIERYVGFVQLARANTALSLGNLTVADAAAQSAVNFSGAPEAYLTQANIADARLSLIAASTTMPAQAAQQAFQAALSSGVNAALTATRLAPNDYRMWVALGNLYAAAVPLNVKGAYDSAKTAYDAAAKLNPTNPQIPYTFAQLDIANKDTKTAETDLKSAIALKQDYTAAIFLLSQLEVADGNVKDALASAEAAAYFTPNDQNILFQVGILRAASNDIPGAIQALSQAVALNPQFANARYFLAAAYARQKDYQDALLQLNAIADLSPDNAKAVKDAQAALSASRDPFPANLLSISTAPVSQAAK